MARARDLSPSKETKEAAYWREILEWQAVNGRDFPWRRTDNPYEILMAELMLQRTRGENVVPIYREFLSRWPQPQALARAREASIAKVLRPLGLTSRSKTFKRLAQVLASEGVPTRPSELQALPGVGPYGSHAVPIFALAQDLPLVDRVIARVLRRFFGLAGDKRPNADEQLWDLAGRLASRGRARDLWLGTLDLAAAVCRARPACKECPLNSWCEEGQRRLVPVTPHP